MRGPHRTGSQAGAATIVAARIRDSGSAPGRVLTTISQQRGTAKHLDLSLLLLLSLFRALLPVPPQPLAS